MVRSRAPQPKRGPVAGRERHRAAVQDVIPEIYATLRTELAPTMETGVVVLFHDRAAARPYGACDLSGRPCEVLERRSYALRAALAPLRKVHAWYEARRLEAPNVFVAFDLTKRQAWQGRTLGSVRDQLHLAHLDAETLTTIATPTKGEPPRLAIKAQQFSPADVPALRLKIGDAADRPEEAFLLSESLLRLAVDSLDGADVIDPLPVHINAMWVFSRPIVMQRPDGSDRHVRMVWFRQGEFLWRIRAYAAGRSMNVKQVGDQITGRRPFVPVWNATRPEQKVLAAIWALMSQGGITESLPAELRGTGAPPTAGRGVDQLTLVRVKAGTEHAQVYGSPGLDAVGAARAAWSVRGHWRRQPYPSLGFDDAGNVRTRPIWIASYTKGGEPRTDPGQKVISVRS